MKRTQDQAVLAAELRQRMLARAVEECGQHTPEADALALVCMELALLKQACGRTPVPDPQSEAKVDRLSLLAVADGDPSVALDAAVVVLAGLVLLYRRLAEAQYQESMS